VRIRVDLQPPHYAALCRLAGQEYRKPEQQAAAIIAQHLAPLVREPLGDEEEDGTLSESLMRVLRGDCNNLPAFITEDA
jgi:hypothetical protein